MPSFGIYYFQFKQDSGLIKAYDSTVIGQVCLQSKCYTDKDLKAACLTRIQNQLSMQKNIPIDPLANIVNFGCYQINTMFKKRGVDILVRKQITLKYNIQSLLSLKETKTQVMNLGKEYQNILDDAVSILVGYNIKYGTQTSRALKYQEREYLTMNEERIAELEKQIKHHNDLYWNGKELEISDVEYDSLVEELKKLDPENELILTFAKPDNLQKSNLIKHSFKMLSLDKIYSKDDLVKWVKKVSRTKNEKFIIQPKYDGMSGLLENGKLSSRGDGEYGQDYTSKLPLIKFIGKDKVNVKTDKLLGEILITNSDFTSKYQHILSKNGEPFKNQRNGIAGILGTDDVEFYSKQGAVISFVIYGSFGFRVSSETFADKWDIAVEKIRAVNYPIDGIVIKLEDEEYGKSLGETAHHPKNAVAFKFTNQSAISVLRGVEWGMGKSQISAIGLIDPVQISGSTIRRVKLQLTAPKNTDVNSYILDGSLQIGDTVVIEKAGDIIPHVVSSTPGKERKVIKLEKCPFCGAELKIEDSIVSCTNLECTENLIQNLYCSIVTLGFKNIGEAFVRLLVNDKSLNIKTIYDILSLQLSDLKLKEYGTKTKENFINEIIKAKSSVTKVQMLSALNIPRIGKNVSQILIDNFTWDEIINNKMSLSKLNSINGLGEVTIETIKTWFDKKSELIHQLNEFFEFKETDTESTKSSGKTICFTGKMSMQRSQLESIATSKGLVPKDTVDKTLNILVCADPNSGSSKLQKATKYGIKIISEDDFLNNKF